MALESCKAPHACHNVRVIERKYSVGQKYLIELKRCSNYRGSSNRELLMRIYQKVLTVPEESFRLRRGSVWVIESRVIESAVVIKQEYFKSF